MTSKDYAFRALTVAESENFSEYPGFAALSNRQETLMKWLMTIGSVQGLLSDKLSEMCKEVKTPAAYWSQYRRNWIAACREQSSKEVRQHGLIALLRTKPKAWINQLWEGELLQPPDGTTHGNMSDDRYYIEVKIRLRCLIAVGNC
jgi:hypothetical protein